MDELIGWLKVEIEEYTLMAEQSEIKGHDDGFAWFTAKAETLASVLRQIDRIRDK